MNRTTKRAMALGLPIAAVAATGIAFAASTALTSGSLGAGDSAVAACQDAATVNYTTAFDATTSQYDLDHVNIAFPSATADRNCNGFDWKLTVVDNGTDPVSFTSAGTGTAIANNALSVDVSSSSIPAEDVTHVAFVVSKDASS